jgi:hypothetical protein
LSKYLSGEEHLNNEISSKAISLLVADKITFAGLLETINIPWRISNFIALEPIQKKILEEDSPEQRIVQLLHLARLRGGIADLLEILSLECKGDQQFGYSIVNAHAQLKNKCYRELIN